MWRQCLSLCLFVSVCLARDVREIVQADRQEEIIHRPRRETAQCQDALGMESGEIPDHAITVSSSFMDSLVGSNSARIRKEKLGGAWCPRSIIDKQSYEFIQIDLETLHTITIVEIQGRFGNGQGHEWTEQFRLEYQREEGGQWMRFKDKTGNEYLKGNQNTYTVEKREVSPPIIGRQIRFIPYSDEPRTICMRVEIYGCKWQGTCINDYNLNALDGTVNNPTVYLNGSPFYRGAEDCVWRFTNDDGAFIKLTSIQFAVQNSDNCEFDYVEITEEGVAESVRVCGRDPVGYISTGPNVNIRFVTDESLEDEGFAFYFKRLVTGNMDSSRCDSSVRGGPDGHIQNALSETTSDCFYRIQAPDAEHVVELELKHLDFGSNICKDECIVIYKGLTTRNEMGRIDKNSKAGVLDYRANSVFIRYTRGVEAEGERFRLAYRFVEVNSTLSTISSITYQNDNEFMILSRNTALHNHVVKIEFVNFELEPSDNCEFDYLKEISSERKGLESLDGPYYTELRGKTCISNSGALRRDLNTSESFSLFEFRAKIKFIPTDDCKCSEGFVCVIKDNAKVCKEGTDCSSTNFCENGGTCVNALNDQVCYCQTGFTGETCTEEEGGIKTLRFSITPRSKNVRRNQGIDAECQVDVDTTEDVEYMWTLRGNLIGPYNADTGFGYFQGGLLIIEKFSDKMEGIYSCIAKTTSSQVEYSFKYTLIEDCSIHISRGPQDAEKKVGQRVLFECFARNAESITWKKDGKPIDIEHDNRIQIRSNIYLRINNIQKSDEGTYKCIAAGHGCFSYREAELRVSTDKSHKNYCGRSVHDVNKRAHGYISQDYTAREKMHPWHVNFMTDVGDLTTDELFCGGTIISQKYVLTAANCMTGFLKKYPGKTIEDNVKLFIGTNDCTGKDYNVTIRRPKTIWINEEFDQATLNNDIAIIELSSPVVYSDNIRPICLESAVFTNMLMTDSLQTPYGRVVGCGVQSRFQRRSDTLKEVYVPYVPQTECQYTMEAAVTIPITDSMFCAGEKLRNQGDACSGDSGGSLVLTRDSIQYWVQTGIVSWGVGCDKTGVYGVYTNVALFYDWIKYITHFDEEVVAPFL